MVATLFQRTPATTALVEPEAPLWAQRMVLKMLRFWKPMRPETPVAIWRCNKADLPLAADWEGCLVVVPDQTCLAIAKGGQWLKISTAGPV